MAKTQNPAAPHFSVTEVRKNYKRADFINDLKKVSKKKAEPRK